MTDKPVGISHWETNKLCAQKVLQLTDSEHKILSKCIANKDTKRQLWESEIRSGLDEKEEMAALQSLLSRGYLVLAESRDCNVLGSINEKVDLSRYVPCFQNLLSDIPTRPTLPEGCQLKPEGLFCTSTGKVAVAQNDCYGGFGTNVFSLFLEAHWQEFFEEHGISRSALPKENANMKQRGQRNRRKPFCPVGQDRWNPVLTTRIVLCGSLMHSQCARLGLEFVDPIFLPHLELNEYDGAETIIVRHDDWLYTTLHEKDIFQKSEDEVQSLPVEDLMKVYRDCKRFLSLYEES